MICSFKKQDGFTLIELVAAMVIISIIATVGLKTFNNYIMQAKYIKAYDNLKVVANGLDIYYLQHGTYPVCSSYETLVNADSVLVKEDLIPGNTPSNDPWGNSYDGRSDNSTYILRCVGETNNKKESRSIILEPGRYIET